MRKPHTKSHPMVRLKAFCCIFFATCTSIPLASETPHQEDGVTPTLIAIQTELGLMRALTKDAVRLQKESLFLQEATLTEIADILAREKLQATNFDKRIDALQMEQSIAARNGLWATSFLGILLVILFLKLWLPTRKREPSLGATPPLNDGGKPSNANIKTSTVTSPPFFPDQQTANDDTIFEIATSKIATSEDVLMGSHPFISSIQVEKAAPLLFEDEASHPPIKESLGDDLSIILAQAEKIRQESLGKISHPQKQNHIPLFNLSTRHPNSLSGNRNSITEKIIRKKIFSLREPSKR